MAIPKVKGTYSMDAETVRMLEGLARRWNVSKSEALRRAIHGAADAEPAARGPLAALEAAQRAMGLSPKHAARWQKRARTERRASSRKGEPGR
ncbi:MAG TPA: ribbon-helix-helix protein, CopG family [Planctomycetota bacterium]|nr:ribbon-helix-helix protein, CopG family [Planctomycetota bacterium]